LQNIPFIIDKEKANILFLGNMSAGFPLPTSDFEENRIV